MKFDLLISRLDKIAIDRNKYILTLIHCLWILLQIVSPLDRQISFYLITLGQFFLPGLLICKALNIFDKSWSQLLVFSFLFSYCFFILTALPSLFFVIKWSYFQVHLIIFNIILQIFYLYKIKNVKPIKYKNSNLTDYAVISLGVFFILFFSDTNFRNDGSFYNKRINDSVVSDHILVSNYDWEITGKEAIKQKVPLFHHDYKSFYNFLAFPIKLSNIEGKYAWHFYNKLMIFLCIVSTFSFGKVLFGKIYGLIALGLFFINIFPLSFYYGLEGLSNGVAFSQAAYPRFVGDNIFLLGFYISFFFAIRENKMGYYFVSSFLLFSILSIHYLPFIWAVLNFMIFLTIYCFFVLRTNINEKIRYWLRSSLLAGSLSFLYILALVIFTPFLSDLTNYQINFQANYPRYQNLQNLTFFEILMQMGSTTNLLVAMSLFVCTPILILLTKERGIRLTSIFLISNLLLYVILKFPLYNYFLEVSASAIKRIDGFLLTCFIIAYIIYSLVKNIEAPKFHRNRKFTPIIILLFISWISLYYSQKETFHNWGNDYLKMTQYIHHIKNETENNKAIVVLSDYKAAVDINSYTESFVFQFENIAYGPVVKYKSKYENLIFYPEDSKTKEFLNNNRVDYIVIPKKKTGYLTIDKSKNINSAINNFYNKLEEYELSYNDSYYNVYRKTKISI